MLDGLVAAHRGAYALIHRLDPGAKVTSNAAYIPAHSPTWTPCSSIVSATAWISWGVDYYYGGRAGQSHRGPCRVRRLRGGAAAPAGLYAALMDYARRYPGVPLYVVENGVPPPTGTATGRVDPLPAPV